jgi:4-diphosphocytidyl-2-C-methyl-D-erythritol kinase
VETTIRNWPCHAKINLYLRVLGPLPGGFHELETLFQEIDLADVIRWKPGKPPLDFHVTGPVSCPRQGNLVVKAVDAFVQATGIRVGGEMTLVKHIPVGAGLGGGSSDAAGILKGLNQSFGSPLSPGALVDLMVGLGSDVAFFDQGGTQIGRGRGDRLVPTQIKGVPRSGFVLFPPCALSTAKVYAHVRIAKPWMVGARTEVCVGENDLLASALACAPSLQSVYLALLPAFRKRLFFMTGSGSTFVWLTRRPSAIEGELAELLASHSVAWHSFSFVASSPKGV